MHPRYPRRRHLVTVPLVVAGLLALVACGDDDESSSEAAEEDFPMTFENCGQDVTIEAPPERVITVGAEAPALVAAAAGPTE
jgi:iron complex transport system substrate-binding protein